jgi:hypothetical protein
MNIEYNSELGGFITPEGELKYPLIAGRDVPMIIFLIVLAMEYPEDTTKLQRVYSELLENYTEIRV